MKKIALIFIILLSIFALSSCFLFDRVTNYPDMKEYSEEEVLLVARDKYSVTEWLFTGAYFRGETKKTENGLIITPLLDDFSADYINGDNIDAAITAFAGKNGGHDIQGHFHHFLCYVALARCADGSLKYIYYNTNINKNRDIYSTVGASDYNLDLSPENITDSLFTADSEWGDMTRYLTTFHGLDPADFLYSRKKLTYRRYEMGSGETEIEFYRENDRVVFDVFHDRNAYDGENFRLIYSTSDRYGVIYNGGGDYSDVFDVNIEILPSAEETNVTVLWGSIEAKEICGEVIYSEISFRAEYPSRVDGKLSINESSDKMIDTLKVKRGYAMENAVESDFDKAEFLLTDYYILYKKPEIAK